MKTKLTLNIEDDVIVEIKTLSKKRKQSVSSIVEDYLRELTLKTNKKSPTSGETFTERFRKAFPSKSIKDDYNYKEERHKYLDKKYGRK